MNDLIKIENTAIGSSCVPTVSARELHEFLESKQRFADWIKKRIKDGGFLENKDFISLHKNMTREIGATSRIEYYITIEMAKHLGMMERNEKGYEIRDYFIECEKEYKKTIENYIPKTLPDALEAYALELRRHEETKLLLEEAKPKADFYDIAVASSSTVGIGEAAKILKYKGTGRNNLFKFLRREGVLMKNNAPKQEYVNKGWFKLVEYKVNEEVKIKTLVYQKGLDGIRKMLDEAGLLPEER